MSDPQNQPLQVAMIVAIDLETQTFKIAVPLSTDRQESVAARLMEIVVRNLPYITAEEGIVAPASACTPGWVH